MEFPKRFISAGTKYAELDKPVPAPYMRRRFTVSGTPAKASLIVCGLGFYEAFINGERITKGRLAPYISNPDDLVYYDEYDVARYLREGENVIGLWLGNGLTNNPGGKEWHFDRAAFRAAPKAALRIDADGEVLVESGEDFVVWDSPVVYDDYRFGERYDARLETPRWCDVGFDDSGWRKAVLAEKPRGEARVCEAEPIVVTGELAAVSVVELESDPQAGRAFQYDFGVNAAGVCRVRINGEAGQRITLSYGEHLIDGRLSMQNIQFGNENIQKDVYICAGGEAEYTPTFTYHGFRYVVAEGIPDGQEPPELTYLVMNTRLDERGGFACSDETANALCEMTKRSTLANFFHFPTDCPQREKNGWTADAALSTEHTLMFFGAEKNYREWTRNIRKAMNDKGALPGIVPTGGWGFDWGNGPAWDCALVWIPYYVYKYRGDKEILRENAHAILRYLEYLTTVIGGDGLIEIGLGDWCPTGRSADAYKSPVWFTDTMISMDIAAKAEFIFGQLGYDLHKNFAKGLKERLRSNARKRLVDFGTMTAAGNCQTSQAMAIYYGLFNESEKPAAFARLVDMVEERGRHMDVGVLGARALFHVLAEFGKMDLAFGMITRRDFPAYGWWVEQGATSLWELFQLDVTASLNHHFWGDINNFFVRRLAGIDYNPRNTGGEVDVVPNFAEGLTWAEGYYSAPEGEIRVRWERNGDGITLDVAVPEGLKGFIRLTNGYSFADGVQVKRIASGLYSATERKTI